MKKFLALFVAFIVTVAVAAPASAQAKFKDVPDDHWAASSVYDLVRLGVSRGYPDGTFRGKNNITRYETAVLIAKLAEVVSGEDVKADIAALRNEIAALKRVPKAEFPLSGSCLASWKIANIFTEEGGLRGTIANYRLKLSTVQDLGEGANVKVNLDTMDYGYYDSGMTMTGGILASELLDIETNLKLDMAAMGLVNPVDVKVTYGPGNMMHTDPTGSLPSEVGVTYMRPDTGVMASTNLWGVDVSGGYIAQTQATSGKVNASEIVGTIGYAFEGVPLVNTLNLSGTGQYISVGQFSSDDRDIRGMIDISAPLTDKIEASGTIGIGGTENKNLMVGGSLALNDVFDTGTVAIIRASKVGSEFITTTNATIANAEWDFAGFDSFDRPLVNASVNIGGEVVQTVAEGVKLIGKGDVRLEPDFEYEAPKGRLTAEGGISYSIAPNTTLDAMYRIHQDKATDDTADIAALGLLYSF